MELNRFKSRGKFLLLCVLSLILWSSHAWGHGISDADKQAMVAGGYLDYAWLGALHMLTGYDHLLFLFGVIFFLSNVRDILKFVTVFTVGHSFTLIFATILGITANAYLIDAVIALSVCYKGFDNLGGFKKYLQMESPNLLKMVTLFGLIHGFGLSTRLQQLPLGDDTFSLILRIISFNVGVELGQVAALLVMVGLLAGWRNRKSFLQFNLISNFGLIICGFLLFIMQWHGYLHEINPDEFGFNEDAHHHVHEDMEEEQVLKEFGEGLVPFD